MTGDLAEIEGQLDAPYDMPKSWRAWMPRFLISLAANDQVSAAQRFKAVELLLKIEAISRAALATGPAEERRGPGPERQLQAIREHLLPLGLGCDDDDTDEIARQAVTEIVRLRIELRKAQTARGHAGTDAIAGRPRDRPDPAGAGPGAQDPGHP